MNLSLPLARQSALKFVPLLAGLAALFLGSAREVRAQAPKQSRANWVHVTGVVTDGVTGKPLPEARIILQGPPLMGPGMGRFSNGELKRFSGADGKYLGVVPAGTYDFSAQLEGYEMAELSITLVEGTPVVHDFKLQPMRESASYRVETLSLPRQMIPEVSGLAFTPKGSLVAATRRGEVWIRNWKTGDWSRFASGLQECFGVVADSESQVYVTTRAEITRLADTTGSGQADVFETVCQSWGMTGNYHEFPYGLVRDHLGNFYGANGMASRDADNFKGVLTRGKLDTHYFGPGPELTEPQHSVVPYQGWAYEVTHDGDFIPFAAGFREPIGIGMSPRDELFMTDVAGCWVPTSTLMHVQRGGFYGHPDGLKWDPNFRHTKLTPELLGQLRIAPAVYIPHGPLGTAAGQPVWDVSNGKFGPFSGQVFLGDDSGLIMRIDLETVAGAYQGAVFPFISNVLRIGSMRSAFAPDGSLYIGQNTRGWMPETGQGIQRIVWTGVAPVEILRMLLTRTGFSVSFTVPMKVDQLSAAKNFRVRRFQYNYNQDDGSLEINSANVPVTGVKPNPDGTGVEVNLLELQPEYIYELKLDGVQSQGGTPLANPSGYYTANHLLAGSAFVAKSALVSTDESQAGPPDPKAGEVIFRQLCMVCHQADGKGSAKVGTPDFTAPNGPLFMKAPEVLVAQVTYGGKIMPAFGHQLSRHDIDNVLAYVKQAFLSPR